jgi:hypothetical protein
VEANTIERIGMTSSDRLEHHPTIPPSDVRSTKRNDEDRRRCQWPTTGTMHLHRVQRIERPTIGSVDGSRFRSSDFPSTTSSSLFIEPHENRLARSTKKANSESRQRNGPTRSPHPPSAAGFPPPEHGTPQQSIDGPVRWIFARRPCCGGNSTDDGSGPTQGGHSRRVTTPLANPPPPNIQQNFDRIPRSPRNSAVPSLSGSGTSSSTIFRLHHGSREPSNRISMETSEPSIERTLLRDRPTGHTDHSPSGRR